MLADPRATDALVKDFAAQWLNLRLVEDVVVDPDKYPTYDLSLLQGFEQETELFVTNNVREDRPVAELLDADYTFVNERLARHYGIPGVYGTRFRKVTLPLSLPGVFAAFLFVFIPTLGEFVTPSLVGGTSGYMYGNQIVDLFGTGFPDWQTGSVLAIFLLLVVAVLTVVFARFLQPSQVTAD